MGRELQLEKNLEILPLGKVHIWKDTTWENTLGKFPLGKIFLGSCQFVKLLWENA